MLERVWRKGNPLTLLVGMQTSTAVMEKSSRQMDKEAVVCIHNGKYSAIKKNTFESVLMGWIKLKPILQSEVSQKEKHQYSILMHIYGI